MSEKKEKRLGRRRCQAIQSRQYKRNIFCHSKQTKLPLSSRSLSLWQVNSKLVFPGNLGVIKKIPQFTKSSLVPRSKSTLLKTIYSWTHIKAEMTISL